MTTSALRTEQKNKEPEHNKPYNWRKVAIWGSLIIVLSWLFTLAAFLWLPPIIEVGNRGTFGDMFGGLTSIFSGMAFLGIIVSIIMQHEELKYTRGTLQLQITELELTRKTLEAQRDELQHTRETLDAQKNELSSQSKTMARQQFESTFYQLHSYFERYLNGLQIQNATGRAYFKVLYGTASREAWDTIRSGRARGAHEHARNDLAKLPTEKAVVATFFEWLTRGTGKSYGGFGSLFGEGYTAMQIYFRMLRHIVSYVDSVTTLSEKDKQFYLEIVISQLSPSELHFLFYYCLTPDGEVEMYPLMVKYSFFRNFDKEKLLHPSDLTTDKGKDHRSFWPDKAFKVL